MFERARAHLSLQRSVVLDATFLTGSQRERARDVAASARVPAVFVQTVAPDDVIRDRLEARNATSSASAARWDTYLAQRARFRPLDDVAPDKLVTLDTTRPLDELVDEALGSVAVRSGPIGP